MKDDGFGKKLENAYAQLVSIAKPGYAAIANDAAGGKTTIEANGKTYRIDGVLAQGDISTVYGGYELCENERRPVAIKIIDEPADNDLAQNEARILDKLRSIEAPQHQHLPILLDRFTTEGGRRALIFERLRGYSFDFIREEAYPQGVHEYHAGWILARTLSAAGFAHSQKIVHANIEPAHLLVRPADHNVFLIDWSYAAADPMESGDGFRAVNENYSAPEVAAKSSPRPGADIYSIGKCLIYLLGGDVATDELPDDVDERFQNFLRAMTLKSAMARPQDAWDLYRKLRNLREEIYGKLTFETFDL